MRAKWWGLVALMLLAATERPAMAESLNVSDATRTEIAAVIAAEDEAWNSGDAEGFAARVLPDVVFTNVMGMFSVGKTPFLVQHQRIFSTIYKGSTNRQTVQHITLLKPDVAIVDTLAVLKGTQHAPPGVEPIDGAIHARLEQVLVRKSDGWWVASFHNVAVNPAVAGGPSARP